jgi:hypothetical protein
MQGAKEKLPFVHLFAKTIEELTYFYHEAKTHLAANGMLWISWPKQSAKVESEINKNDIMKFVLADGMVDVKVVSINETWSGLKFLIRKKDR